MRHLVPLTLVVALLMAACVEVEVGDPVDGPSLEVFTNYRGADADAFRTVLDDFAASTGIRVRHVGTAEFAPRIRERVAEGDLPDLALVPQPSLIEQFARDRLLVPLDDVLPADTGGSYVTGAEGIGMVDGVRYGTWYRLQVKSLVWHPSRVFDGAQYPVPQTWDDLLTVTAAMQRDGSTPWCVGIEAFDATGWMGTDWIEDLVLRLHGADVYDAWAAGDIPFTDPRIRQAFEAFGRVALVDGRVAGGTRAVLSTPVLQAIDPMLEDPRGCLMTKQASFQSTALPDGTVIGPEGDVDVFALPGAEPEDLPLVAAGEIAATFTDSPDARALAAFLATPASGVLWAREGGFVSPHQTFDPSRYADAFDRRIARLVTDAALVRFDASDQMAPDVGTGTFWQGIIDYIAGVPLPQVLEEIEAGYDADADAAAG
jgi:alpha-glucoside transport system substrate-binding protein